MMPDVNRVDTGGRRRWYSTWSNIGKRRKEKRVQRCIFERGCRGGERVISPVLVVKVTVVDVVDGGDGAEELQDLSLEPELPSSPIGETDDGKVSPASII